MKAVFVMLVAVGAIASPAPQKLFFSRVFPVPGQVGLFVAAADGSDERPLLASPDIDYNPAWSPDAAWIVFTSERAGSADLYRARPNGADLERLTDSPAFDDQAAFSPDGRQLVFVTSRAGGTADLWTLDLQTRRAKPLTSGAGGDFRPAWSPDGRWIAFSSDRGSGLPFAHGRWEHLHLVDIYVIRPDGSGLKRVTEHGNFCGSPKWSSDSLRIVAYCMSAEETLTYRQPRLDGVQPSFHPSGDRYAMTTYVPPPGSNNLLVVESDSDKSTVVFHQDGRSVLGPQWSARGDAIIFGIGRFGAFFNGFHDLFLK